MENPGFSTVALASALHRFLRLNCEYRAEQRDDYYCETGNIQIGPLECWEKRNIVLEREVISLGLDFLSSCRHIA